MELVTVVCPDCSRKVASVDETEEAGFVLRWRTETPPLASFISTDQVFEPSPKVMRPTPDMVAAFKEQRARGRVPPDAYWFTGSLEDAADRSGRCPKHGWRGLPVVAELRNAAVRAKAKGKPMYLPAHRR